MKASKITKLLSLLTTGVVVGGAATGGVFVGMQLNSKNNPQDDTRVDLSTYSGALINSFLGIPNTATILTEFSAEHEINAINDLSIQDINPTTGTFKVVTESNSSYFKDNTYATCQYFLASNDYDWTTLTGNIVGSNIQVFEDNEITRNAMLNDLAVQFPTLDVNQLYIDTVSFNQDNKQVTVRTVTDSIIYAQKSITLIAGFTKAISFVYPTPTISATTQNSGNAIFKYHGTTISTGVTYASVGTMSAPLSLNADNGNVYYSAESADFAGGLYTISATYTDSNNITWVEYAQIYAREYNYAFVITYHTPAQLATFVPRNGDSRTLPFSNWSLINNAWDGILIISRYSSGSLELVALCDNAAIGFAYVGVTATTISWAWITK